LQVGFLFFDESVESWAAKSTEGRKEKSTETKGKTCCCSSCIQEYSTYDPETEDRGTAGESEGDGDKIEEKAKGNVLIDSRDDTIESMFQLTFILSFLTFVYAIHCQVDQSIDRLPQLRIAQNLDASIELCDEK